MIVDRRQSADSNVCALCVCAKRAIGNTSINARQAFKLIDVLCNAFSRDCAVRNQSYVPAESSLRSSANGAAGIDGPLVRQRILEQSKEPGAIRADCQSLESAVALAATDQHHRIQAGKIQTGGIVRKHIRWRLKSTHEDTLRQKFVNRWSVLV